MRNASHNQAQVKVAVLSAQAPSPEALRQQRQEQIVLSALIGLSVLALLGLA